MFQQYAATAVSAPARAEYWQGAVSNVVFPLASSFAAPEAFRGTLKSWDLGRASVVYMASDAIRYSRERQHLAADKEECVLASFAARSDICFSQDGLELTCRKNQFLIERSHRPSLFVQPDVNEIWSLKLSISQLRPRIRTIDQWTSLVCDAENGAGGMLFDMLRLVPRRIAGADPAVLDGIGRSLIDLLVLAIENDPRALTSHKSSVQAGHLARIEKFIRQNLSNPALSTDLIARAHGISTRYLHCLFSGRDLTLGQWIRELRLEACRDQLSEPACRETVAEIAYRWGFSDQAQFSRHFKARFGHSPRECRAMARCGLR
jgi:AraC-like DNA-binding protein